MRLVCTVVILALPSFTISFGSRSHNNLRSFDFKLLHHSNKLRKSVTSNIQRTAETSTTTKRTTTRRRNTSSTTTTTTTTSTMNRTTFVQRLLKGLTIQSLFIGGTSSNYSPHGRARSTAAFAFSPPNESNSNNNNMNNNNDNLKDLFNDGTTYGFEDGTTFSMTSSTSSSNSNGNNNRNKMNTKPKVAYRPLALRSIEEFDGVAVPVAMWFRPDDEDDEKNTDNYGKEGDGTAMNENNVNVGDTVTGIGGREGTRQKLIMDYPSIETSIPATASYSSSSSSSTISSSLSTSDDDGDETSQPGHAITYKHRISIKKIGSMLARLNFIPEFLSKDFTLEPTSSSATIIDGTFAPLPRASASTNSINKPIVILSHGFLGSRFDLSHIGEALALEGFIVFSPEYPESLSSSYDSTKIIPDETDPDGNTQYEIKLDRATINNELLKLIKNDLNIEPSSYGIVGHSLGTGTAMNTGDDSWTRVCIAGPPIRRKSINGIMTQEIEDARGSILSIVSINDGAVTMNRLSSMIPDSFVRLDESRLFPPNEMDGNKSQNQSQSQNKNLSDLPPKSILIIDRDDAPNHISFLAGNVNDAMVSFLSPLLPVAQALNIPVLDFDKYKESRDSVATSEVVIPLVSSFLKQYMIVE